MNKIIQGDIKYFVPIYGSYYHFICESVLGLFRMLERESILGTRECRLWYQGPYSNIVQMFSRHPVVNIPISKPYLRDALTIGEGIKTLQYQALNSEESFAQLKPLASYLGSLVSSEEGPRGITIIKRVKRRVYSETEELALMLRKLQVPVRVVQMELETFASQINIMRHTRILVAPHGAGTINQAFMRPGGHVIELFPKGYANWHARAVATVFGHDLVEIESDTPGLFGREPSDEIRQWIVRNGWPDRTTVQAARRRSEELHRVVRDVESYSIPPKRVMSIVESVLCRSGLD
jgi:hypothetical protein